MPELRVSDLRPVSRLPDRPAIVPGSVPSATMAGDLLMLSGVRQTPWEPFARSGKLFLDMTHPELREQVFALGWQHQDARLVPEQTRLHYATAEGWQPSNVTELQPGGHFQLPEGLKEAQVPYAIEATLRNRGGETRIVWLNNHGRNCLTNRPATIQQAGKFDLYHSEAFNDTTYRYINQRRNDPHPHMPRLLREAGLNVTPTVVSAAEFDDAVRAGATPLMRGTPDHAAHDFRYNPDTGHVPAGTYGTGFYFAQGEGAFRVAAHFASPNGGILMRAALKPAARVVTEGAMTARMAQAKGAWMEEARRNLAAAGNDPGARDRYDEALRKGETLFSDPGLAALHFGDVDAMRFPNDYVVVLNRSALLVDETNYRPMTLPPGARMRPEQVPPGFLTGPTG